MVLFRLGGSPSSAASAMLTRLVCQDLLTAGAALRGIGVGGDGIVWLAECGSMPRSSVTELIARGSGAGPAGARGDHLARRPRPNSRNSPTWWWRTGWRTRPRRAASTACPAWGDGEFLLAVKQPPRLVPRGRRVRTRIPGVARRREGA